MANTRQAFFKGIDELVKNSDATNIVENIEKYCNDSKIDLKIALKYVLSDEIRDPARDDFTVALISKLKELKVNINYRFPLQEESRFCTLLYAACFYGSERVVAELLSANADVNQGSFNYAEALDPDDIDSEQQKNETCITPAYIAALIGRVDIIKLLLKAEVDVDKKSDGLYSSEYVKPIDAAISQNNFEVALYLLRYQLSKLLLLQYFGRPQEINAIQALIKCIDTQKHTEEEYKGILGEHKEAFSPPGQLQKIVNTAVFEVNKLVGANIKLPYLSDLYDLFVKITAGIVEKQQQEAKQQKEKRLRGSESVVVRYNSVFKPEKSQDGGQQMVEKDQYRMH